jgi:hypothetical protein
MVKSVFFHLRTKNVENLKTPTVNNEIWRHLDRRVKNQDLKLSKTQALICRAITPQLQLIDILLNKQSKKENLQPKDVIQLAMATLKVMTFVYCDLSCRRREMIIQPGKNEEFRGLCFHDHPVQQLTISSNFFPFVISSTTSLKNWLHHLL